MSRRSKVNARNGRQPDWSIEHKNALRQGFAEGRSYAQIARGIDRTRNAIAGKMQRLGLRRRGRRVGKGAALAAPCPRDESAKPRGLGAARLSPPYKGAAQ